MKTNIGLVLALCATFVANAQNYNEVAKIVASDRGVDDFYGYAVDISGDYAIVGAYLEDEDATGTNAVNNAGSVFIYERDAGGNWNQAQKIVASDRALNDEFGYSVSISGDYAVIGARWEDHDVSGSNNLFNAGSAYVFERDGTGNWNEVAKIVASDRGMGDEFGTSVSISGDYLIVGALEEEEDTAGTNTISGAGSAYVFERDGGGNWLEVQKLVASDRDLGDKFGTTVAISGTYLVVGAPQEDEDATGSNTIADAGSAYVFERDGSGVWNEEQKIVTILRDVQNEFSWSLAIDGDYILMASPWHQCDNQGSNCMNGAGAVAVFERDGAGTWNQNFNHLLPSDRASQDNFGRSVAIDGDYAIIGANLEDANGVIDAGSAYLFFRTSGNNWSEVQKISSSDGADTDIFASSVGISNNYIIAGAYWEDHNTQGIDSLDRAGSAYIFETCSVDTSVAVAGFTLTANQVGASYQWVDCDNGFMALAGETNQAFTATANGNYAVVVTTGVSCSDTSACYNIDGVGINEHSGLSFAVYPNPTNGQVVIELNELRDQPFVYVTDIAGRQIVSRRVINTSRMELNLPGQAGVYLIHLESRVGRRSTQKVVKQ